jgi:hypothetical protein
LSFNVIWMKGLDGTLSSKRKLVILFVGEYHLLITDTQLEDDAVFECQVGATVDTPGLRSRQAKLSVLGLFHSLSKFG